MYLPTTQENLSQIRRTIAFQLPYIYRPIINLIKITVKETALAKSAHNALRESQKFFLINISKCH